MKCVCVCMWFWEWGATAECSVSNHSEVLRQNPLCSADVDCLCRTEDILLDSREAQEVKVWSHDSSQHLICPSFTFLKAKTTSSRIHFLFLFESIETLIGF